MSLSAMDVLVARHAGHHHNENVVFGYIILVLSILNIVSIGVFNFLAHRYHYRLSSSSSSSSSSSRLLSTVKRLASVPLYVQCLVWFAIAMVCLFVPFIPAYLMAPNQYSKNIWVSLIRRFGRVAYSMVPFIVFLGIKPNPLPQTFYLSLLPLHKWLARISVFLVVVHGIGFFVKWTTENSVSKKALRSKNLSGVVVFAAWILVALVSLRPLRRKLYMVFYPIHTLTAWISLFLISYHARPQADLYTVLSVILLIFSVLVKIFTTKSTAFEILSHEGSSLILARFPIRNLVSFKKQDQAIGTTTTNPNEDALKFFTPGSHVRISASLKNYKAWLFATHPYTVASLSTDQTVDLVVKKTSFQLLGGIAKYSVSAPFPAISPNFFRQANDVVIVCGGSGISFGLPIYRYFTEKRNQAVAAGADDSEQDASSIINVKLVWVIRKQHDLFVLEKLGILSENGTSSSSDIQIFVTKHEEYNEHLTKSGIIDSDARDGALDRTLTLFRKSYNKTVGKITGRSTNETQTVGYRQLDSSTTAEELQLADTVGTSNIADNQNKGENSYELDTLNENTIPQGTSADYLKDDEEQNELSNDSEGIELPQKSLSSPLIHYGRPSIPDLVEEEFRGGGGSQKWLVACGPEQLVQDCRSWAKESKVGFISEVYAM